MSAPSIVTPASRHRAARTLTAVAFLLVASASHGYPGWIALGPPGVAATHVRYAPGSPGVVWLGTPSSGVFRSEDSGTSWVARSGGLEGLAAAVLDLQASVGDPDIAWVAVADGVRRTRNGGVTWERLPNLPIRRPVALFVDPTRPRRLYAHAQPALAAPRPLLRSDDDSTRWRRVHRDLDGVTVGADGAVWAVDDGAWWKSSDGGGHWQRVATLPAALARANGKPPHALAADPQRTGWLWASAGNAIWRSTDGGRRWRRTVTGLGIARTLVVDPASSRTLWAIVDARGLARSDDFGATWTWIRSSDPYARAVDFDPFAADTLLLGTADLDGRGLWRSTDGAETLEPVLAGLHATPLAQLVADPFAAEHLVVQRHAGARSLLASADGGASWTPLPTGLSAPYDLSFDPHVPGRLLVLGPNGELRESTDGGVTFAELPTNGLQFLGAFRLVADTFVPGRYFALGPTLAESTDGGSTWTPLLDGGTAPSINVAFDLVVSPIDPLHLIASAVVPGPGGNPNNPESRPWLFESTDGGSSWARIDEPLGSDRLLFQAVFDPQRPGTLIAGGADGLYRRNEPGGDWEPLSFPGSPQQLASGATALYALTQPVDYYSVARVMVSHDRGSTWSELAASPGTQSIRRLTVVGGVPDAIWLATTSGALSLADTSAIADSP